MIFFSAVSINDSPYTYLANECTQYLFRLTRKKFSRVIFSIWTCSTGIVFLVSYVFPFFFQFSFNSSVAMNFVVRTFKLKFGIALKYFVRKKIYLIFIYIILNLKLICSYSRDVLLKNYIYVQLK